jgi:hypothetical protein
VVLCACEPVAFRRLAFAVSLAAWFCIPAFARAGDRPPSAPLPHLRAIEVGLLTEVREGCRRSPTFRNLVDRIEHSDVVVYLESGAVMPPLTKAYTRWVGASATLRFVRVAVKIPASSETIIALLGHEFEHALEVAAAADVRTEAAFAALYRRIGDQSPGGWDTAAARLAALIVRRELSTGVEPKAVTVADIPVVADRPKARANEVTRRRP